MIKIIKVGKLYYISMGGSMMTRDLDFYMSLPYRVEVIPSPEGGYGARVIELPGCITCADTWE